MEDTIATCKDEVLFNCDTLSKIVPFLPSIDLLSLALTCKRFGISDDEKQSVIKKTVNVLVKGISTEDQLAALPYYDGESSLADYHYLQLLREPLAFDQLVGAAYVNEEDKTCVRHTDDYVQRDSTWKTAFSNNILRSGKHFATFQTERDGLSLIGGMFAVGVMRPGQANQNASGGPDGKKFFQNFSRRMGHMECNNNNVHCCMYYSYSGKCCISNWEDSDRDLMGNTWDGMEATASGVELGMLLDLDEGTLSVYKNGRKLGVMKRGLAGPYCWVASLHTGQATIKRGTIPTS